jgi:hypothetical protein
MCDLRMQDPAVKEAVAELLELKRRLTDMGALQRLKEAIRLERPQLLDSTTS